MVERISNVNWQRILWCCGDRRISINELAVAVNVPYATLERLEGGEDALTYAQLQRIASYFGRGVLFFLEPGPVDPVKVFTNGFRTLANQKAEIDAAVKKIIERAEWQREAYLALRAEVGDERIAEFAPPDLKGKTLEAAATVVRNWLELDGVRNFEGYRRAVESKGILVFRTNGYQGKWQIPKTSQVLGFAIYHEAFPLIVVRKARFESRQVFTLFHELAHILLHKESVIDEEPDLYANEGREREANRFAGLVLVPDKHLNHVNRYAMPARAAEIDGWLAGHRRDWGVSTEVILLRLLDSGRIERHVYDEYKAWQDAQPNVEDSEGRRSYRYREPRHILGDGYVRTVLSALDQRRITLTRASRFLDGLKVDDLHRLEGYYAGH